jgi:hypothetical protein
VGYKQWFLTWWQFGIFQGGNELVSSTLPVNRVKSTKGSLFQQYFITVLSKVM